MFKMKASEVKVCVFCDERAEYVVINDKLYAHCPSCKDYKGLITVEEWEETNGIAWEW